MKKTLLIGISLIILGAVALGLSQYTYKTEEKVFELGPLKATAEHEKKLPIPPELGWVLLVGGILVVVVGELKK
ncbi:hypothetical protein SAMN02745857_03046 [Andreprevotia lacus DSM 23236]|uniref:Uncharacterized protein n=2 Tax=Andreprevotia TaxID=397275 RepID=A0A1W1XVG3_9NEIS|nr:hypothetical protein SAMN02745857_03046 [Andreprevotia lacus DSM 23236]